MFITLFISLNYILCPSYHGATLVALLLNNHPAVGCLGDTVPARTFDQTCACRQKVSSCPFWEKVRKELNTNRFIGEDFLLPWYPELVRSRRLNRLLNRALAALSLVYGPGIWKLGGRNVIRYVEIYYSFYAVVTRALGVSVLVDGQKNLTKVLALRGMGNPSELIRVIHVWRDPRAYLASCRDVVPGISVRRAATQWRRYHQHAERLCLHDPRVKELNMRYEDLCEATDKTMEKIFRFLGVQNHMVRVPPAFPERHHLTGNKLLFKFDGTIHRSLRWQQILQPDEAERMLEQTQPLAGERGYA